MKKIQICISALFLSLALNAQVITKVPAATELQKDSATQVVIPIGEVQDTMWFQGIFIQEREPLKIERFIVISRVYVFENSKYNRIVEQWAVKIKSALNPLSEYRINGDIKDVTVWRRQIGKPKQ